MNTIIFAGLLLTVCLAFASASPLGPQAEEVSPIETVPVEAGELLGAEESRWGGHHGGHRWGGGHHGWGGHHGHHGHHDHHGHHHWHHGHHGRGWGRK